MIEYNTFQLDNGLQVIVHEDFSVENVVINVLYDVGSRDEDPSRTGLAHLFEHLMFGGSKHIPNYDGPLERVGGENNAFTSPDMTNYYLTIPAMNVETGFWLESDRMLSLAFDPQVLEVQRKVVIEEFKQRYLNQPYGDVWLKLRPLAYQKHPYLWPTIGKEISHIEKVTMEEVKSFFHRFYHPGNAILVVAGKIASSEAKALSEKWFGPIPAQDPYRRALPTEPVQTGKRTLEVEAKVPANALYKVFHMPGRFSEDYHAVDLLSDLLGRGKSSRLHQRLVKENPVFSAISAHSLGSIDPGLLVISGKLKNGSSPEQAEILVDEVLEELRHEPALEGELDKIKNQAESSMVFGEVEVLNRAMHLAFAALSGDPGLANTEIERIKAVSAEKIRAVAEKTFATDNSSALYYHAI